MCKIPFFFKPFLRFLRVPKGNANGPGWEAGCKGLSEAKYCHNYYQYLVPLNWSEPELDKYRIQNLNTNHFLNGLGISAPDFKIVAPTFDYVNFIPTEHSATLDLSSLKLVDLSDLLVERNSYFRLGQTQLAALYGDTKLFPENHNTNTTGDLNQLVGILLNYWMQINFLNGVGEWGFNFPIVYQGMCYPSVCSVEDITTNSILFNQRFLIEDWMGLIISSPVLNEGLGKLLNMTADQTIQQSGETRSDKEIKY